MRLIDILNKIANGELKEGTKVIYDEETYILNNENELERELGFTLLDDIYMNNLSDEVELIEPNDFPDDGEMAECKHEWSKYSIGRLGRTENYRRCKKCGIHEEDIEPTDNTKIEELDADYYEDQPKDYTIRAIINKLNEVIRKINKGDNNE